MKKMNMINYADMCWKALEKEGIGAIVPSADDIEIIGNLIYPNLENGIVIGEDRIQLIALAEKYILENNADSLILGCTELPLAIKPGDVSVPILNTTKIHIKEIYNNMIGNNMIGEI